MQINAAHIAILLVRTHREQLDMKAIARDKICKGIKVFWHLKTLYDYELNVHQVLFKCGDAKLSQLGLLTSYPWFE